VVLKGPVAACGGRAIEIGHTVPARPALYVTSGMARTTVTRLPTASVTMAGRCKEAGPDVSAHDHRVTGGTMDDVVAILSRDRVWSAYLLADTETPFVQHSHFFIDTSDREPAVVLLYRHPSFSAVGAYGSANGLWRVVNRVPVWPRTALLLVQPPALDVFQSIYKTVSVLPTLRMSVTAEMFRPMALCPTRFLAPVDLPALNDLLGQYADSAFTVDQLEDGVFAAVVDPASPSRFLSVAGTHVWCRKHRIAAVGNVFTRPDVRGRGYAEATTSAVTGHLLGHGCDDVVLNVREVNTTAIRLYERLGYRTTCHFFEGTATARTGVAMD